MVKYHENPQDTGAAERGGGSGKLVTKYLEEVSRALIFLTKWRTGEINMYTQGNGTAIVYTQRILQEKKQELGKQRTSLSCLK